MIETETALIVGAGGSIPYGFPSGAELKGEVIHNLSRARHASELLIAEFGQDAAEEFWVALKESGQQSVDAFLERRSEFTRLGKLAIAQALLPLEKTGRLFDQQEFCERAGGFVDRLVAYGHPDGYFEEHTNDEREGGPSLVYTPLTAGCAYIVQKWRGRADRDRFSKCGAVPD